ncbi:sensor histidine kinase [Ornithinimicrobium pratense]|uniref:Sensor-like histidine kinase SenX3 n=1 Tax=Ornithinimicrobium pratense TaxID=2593973 RepID=A0A5J6V8Z0_9MICO|nr:GAF domain-containing sensor histidine kinase [Ornithinimicrobium pratense]QFG69591.1 GAF domain-containing sensor histidine kinase [Ornithinimicrobium pratense]
MTSSAMRESDSEIRRYRLLEGPGGTELQSLSDLAARVFDVPLAAINVLTSTQQHQIATTGFPPSVQPREESMCATLAFERGAVVIPDASRDPLFADMGVVKGRPGVRFYASAPLRTPAGVPLGRLCVFDVKPGQATEGQREMLTFMAERVTDVLELRLRSTQLEDFLRELTQVRDELARSNEALWHFASQISHDLRNPLMGVRANAELLAGEPAILADPELSDIVEHITDSARGMTRMIQEVLAHAKQGGGRPRHDWVDLAEVTDRVLLDLSPLIRETQAQVRVDDLPRVPGDGELLYSVLSNVLTNSLKFTRDDVTPEVQVMASRQGSCWRICVMDNGIGVPAGQEKSIFLPYVRARRGDGEPARPGYGIGLATVHRIITAHEGRVGMEPRQEGGTTVWFELPAHMPDLRQEDAAASRTTGLPRSVTTG